MKILAIECSAVSASSALIEDNIPIASSFINVKLTHSQTLLPMIENMLKSVNITFDCIDAIAISNGPGSFTGIRIGISAVKGLAAPHNLPCVGISTLLSMAYNYIDTNCIICCVMDARCNQVYNAIFDIEDERITRLCDDRALLCTELTEELKKLSHSTNKSVIIVGDGTDVFFPYVKDLTFCKKSSCANRYQNAVSVGLASCEVIKSQHFCSPENLLPVYLRLPQAERELKKRG